MKKCTLWGAWNGSATGACFGSKTAHNGFVGSGWGSYSHRRYNRHTGATVRYIFRETRGQGCSVLRTLPSYPLGSDEYHLSPFRNDFTPIFCLAIFSVRLEISSSFACVVISSESISPSESKSFNSFSACAVLLSNEPFPQSSSSTVVSQ